MKITALFNRFFGPKRAVIVLPDLIQYESAMTPAIMAPFNGKMVPVIVKELNQVEIRSCGNFSLIETLVDGIIDNRQPTIDEMVEFSEIQHNICQMSMVKPTYDEVLNIYHEMGSVKKAKLELKDIEFKLAKLELENKPLQYRELYSKYCSIKILANLILPNDFTSCIASYALGLEKSDIKKISREMLLNAAILAEKGSDNPADHLSGNFSAFNREDINNRAWLVLHEEREASKGGSNAC